MFLTSSTGVRRRQGCQLLLEVVDTVDLLLGLVEFETDGGSSGGDMLEGSRGRQTKCFAKFLDESPRIESIQQVNVTWGSSKDCRDYSQR